MLIKYIFQERTPKLLITAPNGFGKTTNLEMLKKYLEIEVKQNGEPKRDIKKSVRYTKNYNLFFKNKLRIRNAIPLMNRHFGRYPIIHVDFKLFNNCTQENIFNTFLNVIHNTYKQHVYLLNSTRLKNEVINNINTFFDDTTYKDITENDLYNSLYYLSKALHKHFDKQVFVLIDEIDTPINNAINIKCPDLNFVIDMYCYLLTSLIKNNDYVRYTVAFGISHITGGQNTCYNSFTEYKFLHYHPFLKYNGLTKNELNKLFYKFNRSNEINIIENHLGSYRDITDRIQLYNMAEIQYYYKYKEIKSYLDIYNKSLIFPLKNSFNAPLIKYFIEQLLKQKSVQIYIPFRSNRNYIDDLYKLALNDNELILYPSLFFFFLLELGYLYLKKIPNLEKKYYGKSKPYWGLIPNEITMTNINLLLNEYHNDIGLLSNQIATCAKFLNDINVKSEKYIFKKFKNSLQILFDSIKDKFDDDEKRNDKKSKNINDDLFRLVIFSVISKSDNIIYIGPKTAITMKLPLLYFLNTDTKTGYIIDVNSTKISTNIIKQHLTEETYTYFDDTNIFPTENLVHKIIIAINVRKNKNMAFSYKIIENKKIETHKIVTVE